MSAYTKNQELSIIRNIFWPVRKHELPKFLSLSFLIFFALFNQNALRILKDSILISEVSAEVTSFVKVYCVMPAAAIFVIIYAKMVNHFSFAKIYYILISLFTGFFALFGFVIYPNIELFHPDSINMALMMKSYPHFQWYIALFGNWSYVILYVLAELWPNIFYVLMCWQIANQITSTDEAKRLYTFISLIGNSSVILVGVIMADVATGNSFIYAYVKASSHKVSIVQIAMTFVCISSAFMILIINYISRTKKLTVKLKDEPKLGLIDSFKYIASSRYLWLMLVCAASFGLTMNLVEAVWKAKIKELHTDMSGYAEYTSQTIMWTGVVIMSMTLIGTNIMRYFGWLVTAMLTPLIILITGVVFFMLVVFSNQTTIFFEALRIASPLALAVYIGGVQNIAAKGSKYSVWDACMQMLYIPLDQELKTKGKAAVDVVSSKIGKSLSSVVQAIAFTIFPFATYDSISPILMIVFIISSIAWLIALRDINKEYLSLLSKGKQ